ncbi:hypothetical protein MBLNU230_g5858t1 [Neophaeotheca triangularis]
MSDDENHSDVLEGLEDRLQSHAKAFDSLLALTPARDYYGSQVADGKDPSEQWNRKKQTAEEKRAAKKAKLDPAHQKSALDVIKENEKKRKRELGLESDGEDEEVDEEQAIREKDGKRRKTDEEEDPEARRRQIAERKKEKRQMKKERIAKKKAKVEAKKAAKQDKDLDEAVTENRQAMKLAEHGDHDEPQQNGDMEKMDMSGLTETSEITAGAEADDEPSSAPSTPAAESPAFDASANHSAASSSSSIVPPSVAEQPKQVTTKAATTQTRPKPTVTIDPQASTDSVPRSGYSSPKLQLPDIDSAALQERLRLRIEELRSRRKADGPEGAPARSRQELLEQRRKKEEARKAHKKELRRNAKEEEERKNDARLRGSGSPLGGADIFESRPKPPSRLSSADNNFAFSRLAFDDGTHTDAGMTHLDAPHKRKGPQDPRTALQAAENKASRIAGYDAEKQADIAEKDLWLNAKKRAHGERVRDDTSLLKKALKRKEKGKSKSEKEWKEREESVRKGKEMKQKKRETNLAKRRDEKGSGGGKKKKPASAGKGKHGSAKKGGAKKGRPGFEGSFKA